MPDIGVLLISGSTRVGSSNTMVLRRLHERAHPGVRTVLYDRLARIPAFVPDEQPQPDEVARLLEHIAAADAVLFSTPEYAGGLPGTLKNLLDWTVGGGQLYGKPVGWLDVANPGRGNGARAQLRTVLGYLGALVVDAACVRVALDRSEGRLAVSPAGDWELSAAIAAFARPVGEDHRDREQDN